MSSLITTVIDDKGIGTLTLNRPERLNAFTTQMIDDWASALVDLSANPEVKVIIITGAGRAFCSGGDTGEVKERSNLGAVATKTYMMSHVHKLARTLIEIDKPVIAALNGLARAGGLDFALLCDIRTAAESATFAESYVNLGMMSGTGGSWLLARLVGRARALELLWTGEPITAREAERIGMVSYVFPDATLLDETRVIAEKIAKQSSIAVRMYKRAVDQGVEQSFLGHLDMVSSHLAILRDSDEHKSRLEAALNKRRPAGSE